MCASARASHLGFASIASGGTEAVGGAPFREGDGLVAAERVCNGDEATREAPHGSLQLDGFLRVHQRITRFFVRREDRHHRVAGGRSPRLSTAMDSILTELLTQSVR